MRIRSLVPLVIFLFVWSQPKPAHACSCGGPSGPGTVLVDATSGVPANARGVLWFANGTPKAAQVNLQRWIDGAWKAEAFEIENVDSGRNGPTGTLVLIAPKRALAPGDKYHLELRTDTETIGLRPAESETTEFEVVAALATDSFTAPFFSPTPVQV